MIGEKEGAGLAVPGLEGHELIRWEAGQPVVEVPPGARARAGAAIHAPGARRLAAGDEIEVRRESFVLRISRVSPGLAAGARRSNGLIARPILWSILGHAAALAILGLSIHEPATEAPRVIQPAMMALRVDPSDATSGVEATASHGETEGAAEATVTFAHVPVRELESMKLAIFRVKKRHWENQ